MNKSATIYTYEFNVYLTLKELGYEHDSVKYFMGEYMRDGVLTNAVDGFFSQMKRMIGGSHIWVSVKHLHLYVSECVFRYNNRQKGNLMFNQMLELMMPKIGRDDCEMPQMIFT